MRKDLKKYQYQFEQRDRSTKTKASQVYSTPTCTCTLVTMKDYNNVCQTTMINALMCVTLAACMQYTSKTHNYASSLKLNTSQEKMYATFKCMRIVQKSNSFNYMIVLVGVTCPRYACSG